MSLFVSYRVVVENASVKHTVRAIIYSCLYSPSTFDTRITTIIKFFCARGFQHVKVGFLVCTVLKLLSGNFLWYI